MRFLQWLLIKLKIVKWSGERTADGHYLTEGINPYTPLSYFLLLIVSIIILITNLFAGLKEAARLWEETFNEIEGPWSKSKD